MNKKCKYCETFRRSTVVKINGIQRRCQRIKELVHINSIACKHFTLSSLIYCEFNHEWVVIELCLSRKEGRTSSHRRLVCAKCRQFSKEIIFHYHEEPKRKLKRG